MIVCAAIVSSISRSPRSISPISTCARPSEGACPLQLLRDAVRAADLFEFGIGLEQCRAGSRRPVASTPGRAARRRAAADARLHAPAPPPFRHMGQRPVGVSPEQQRSRQLAAAEHPGLDPRLPDARLVERRIVHRQAPLEMRHARRSVRPGGRRAVPNDHSPTICRFGSPSRLNRSSISIATSRDVSISPDDNVMCREADQRRNHA